MIMSSENCIQCNNGTLTSAVISVVGTREGEEFTVFVPGLICSACGFKTIDNQQSGEFTKAVSDAYKRAHRLLTGAELRERRCTWLKMSQQDFADYLGVGIASVKRWEAGQIQDRAMDELIRLKTDPEAARTNLRALEIQLPEEHVISSIQVGNQSIDLSFSLAQSFTDKPKMTMGGLRMTDFVFDDDEVLAA